MFAKLDLKPMPEEYLSVGVGRIVVLGRYVGRARDTGVPLEAVFAHVLRVRDGRVTELVQVTDSARWHRALAISEERDSS